MVRKLRHDLGKGLTKQSHYCGSEAKF
jgi:hypothetical protein